MKCIKCLFHVIRQSTSIIRKLISCSMKHCISSKKCVCMTFIETQLIYFDQLVVNMKWNLHDIILAQQS